jgi:hypothetical protein
MDAIVTTKNGETEVLLITPNTPYNEIQNAISSSDSYKFVHGDRSYDFNKKLFDMQGKFNNLTEMLKKISIEGKLDDEQRKIFFEFKDMYDNFMELF